MYMQSMSCKAFNHTFFLYRSIANKGIHLLSSECVWKEHSVKRSRCGRLFITLHDSRDLSCVYQMLQEQHTLAGFALR